MNIDKQSIRRRALELISTDGRGTGTSLSNEFGISRQVANGYLQAMVREGRNVDVGAAKVPLLVIYAPADQVIDVTRIPAMVDAWGGPAQVETVVMGPADDTYSHVIAGDIMSPGQTANVAGMIIGWLADVVQ